MKLGTKNILNYALGLTVLTFLFRWVLSSLLEQEQFGTVWIVALLYSAAIFGIAWFFGKRDKESLPLYDVGFRFHLVSYLICNIIAEGWFFFEMQSKFETVKTVHLTVLFWGLGLLIHSFNYYRTRKNTYKGLKKSEIFE